ncbi:MAG: hypothetical protein HQ509_09510 [Candidatus Marinimicrobia bacterium]|nr:hypothetical protein [Candidatus Neomarinimicrobiota bacterium]
MAKIFETVQSFFGGLIGLLKVVVVVFVLANILWMTGLDPVTGVINLVNSFLDGGFAGLLALLVIVSFL